MRITKGANRATANSGHGTWLLTVTAATVMLMVGLEVTDVPSRSSSNDVSAPWLPRLAGSELESFESLEAMTISADAVVLGRITGLRAGRTSGDSEEAGVLYAEGTLGVDTLLIGDSSVSGSEYIVEFITAPGSTAQSVSKTGEVLPSGQGIYFLRHKGEEARAAGASQGEVSANWPFYRLVNSRALIHDDSGVARPTYIDDDVFLAELNGVPFDDVVQRITAAVEGQD